MNGKGSKRRPICVSQENWNENYERIFDKKKKKKKKPTR